MSLEGVGARIRQRRLDRGWTVRDLAQRIRVSASYISLIENGQKVPTRGLATALARVLEDDERLYVAWAEALRQTNLDETSRVILEYEARLRSPELSMQIVTPDEIQVETASDLDEDLPDSLRNWLKAQSGRTRAQEAGRWNLLSSILPVRSSNEEYLESAIVEGESSQVEEESDVRRQLRLEITSKTEEFRVPILHEGVHPSDTDAEVLGTIRIKRSVVPQREREHLVRPFAWRLSGMGTQRVHRLLRPRDVVIISEDLKGCDPREIFAVRYSRRIVLSRILRKGSITLLLSSRGETDIEVLDTIDPDSGLVGRVALAIRAWHYAVFSPGETKEFDE